MLIDRSMNLKIKSEPFNTTPACCQFFWHRMVRCLGIAWPFVMLCLSWPWRRDPGLATFALGQPGRGKQSMTCESNSANSHDFSWLLMTSTSISKGFIDASFLKICIDQNREKVKVEASWLRPRPLPAALAPFPLSLPPLVALPLPLGAPMAKLRGWSFNAGWS